jgi:hypothetical protein
MVFEYERTDMQSLHEIWAEYAEGRLSFTEAAKRSRSIAHSSVQVFDRASTRPAREVIGDVMSNEEVVVKTAETDTPAGVALPAIDRSDISTDAKVLFYSPMILRYAHTDALLLSPIACAKNVAIFSTNLIGHQ